MMQIFFPSSFFYEYVRSVISNGVRLSSNMTTSVESFATTQYDESLPPVWSSSDASLASSISYLLFNQAKNESVSGKYIQSCLT